MIKKSSLFLCVLTSTLFASPLQPWDQYHCSNISQNDNLKIGAICGRYDSQLGVSVLDIYYFGYLAKNEKDYIGIDANLSVDRSLFRKMGMRKITFGDGYNLPKKEVYRATYIATHSFQNDSDYPLGKDFAIYFLGEESNPVHNPPFSEDSLFGANYRGKIGKAVY